MYIEKDLFARLVQTRLAGAPGPVGGDEVERAAAMLQDVVTRAGRMIEVAADDVLALVADWRREAMDVRVYEAVAPRAVGMGPALGEWLREVEAIVVEVAGGPDLTLHEVASLAERMSGWLPPDVEMVLGARVADELRGRVGVRLVALGAPA